MSNYTHGMLGWDDLVNDASKIVVQGGVQVTLDSVNNGIQYSSSSTTNLTDDHIWFTVQLPHSWKTNTYIYPHVHFLQTAADQTNMWFMRYKWHNIGEAYPADWTTSGSESTNEITYSSGTIQNLNAFPSINGAGKGISSLLDIKLYRKNGVGTGNVTLKQFDIHIQKDGLGSDSEYTKTY
jgi:hypothetical protein